MTVTENKTTEEELQYIVTFDSAGKPMKGDLSYILHLPSGIPARTFWSVIVYDSHTRLIIQNDQKWPSVFSNCKKLVTNVDGSVDIRFGPQPPNGTENNWIKTIPGKLWYLILRLYSPTEAWYNKTWKPCEIEQVQ